MHLSVNTPLKQGSNIISGGERKVCINYKYERLPSFYFYCGKIDHEEMKCRTCNNDCKGNCLKRGEIW